MAFRSPFSGNVSQPWKFFISPMSQFGFININDANTPNPDLEQKILENVGSYGRQIGRIADALDVLVGTLDWTKLAEPQARAILAFREQLAEVRALKSDGRDEKADLSTPPAVFRKSTPASAGAE